MTQQQSRLIVIAAAIALFIIIVPAWFYQPSVPFSSKSADAKASDANAGVSGHLFYGEKVRSFDGARLFADAALKGAAPASSVKPPAHPNKKWLVCTTINKPTEAVTDVIKDESWAAVIVGDLSTPTFSLSAKNAVYLDPATQRAMTAEFGDFLELLPWKHFGRKNLGYLYAILHGAEQVWDVDDDNYMKPGKWPEVPQKDIFTVDVSEDCESFNPYPLMGSPENEVGAWPRGFPFSLIRKPCEAKLTPVDMKQSTTAVFQSLADHEPDVDGVFRLTRNIPFDFDTKSTRTLVIPHGTLTPYNAQATLVLKPALWSLLLPVSVHGRVSDIWRSYIAQRLLWDVGHTIAFTPPQVNQFRNVHNALADMQSEEDLYYRSLALVQFLREWQGRARTLQGRYEELIIELYERGYVGVADVYLTQQWVRALMSVGYEFPPLTNKALVAPARALSPICPRYTNVLVTGASGMVGSHVIHELVSKPCYRVHALVRPRSNLDALADVLDRITTVIGDITDGQRMLAVIDDIRPDYLYHFAAQAINGISYSVPELTLDTNVVGTMNILEAVRRAGLKTKVLLAGSSTVYGRTADLWEGPIPETAPLDPVSPYGVSKVATEKLGSQYYLSFGVHVVIARLFIQVGVGGTDTLAIHEFAKQIAMAEQGFGKASILHGSLSTERDMTDARDSAPVLVALAEMGAPGEAYNVGSGRTTSMQDLLDIAIAQAKVPVTAEVDASRFRVYDEKVLLADITKTKKLTGWEPKTDMTNVISTILDSWRRKVAMLYGPVPEARTLSPVEAAGVTAEAAA